MASFTELFDSPAVHDIRRDVDTALLAHELGARDSTSDISSAVPRLRVAAITSLAGVIADGSADSLLRRLTSADGVPAHECRTAFANWAGFLSALRDADQEIEIEDLLAFAAAGLLADRSPEVRALLRQDDIRRYVDRAIGETAEVGWANRIRHDITTSLLLLVRQDNHSDVAAAVEVIQRLSDEQEDIEATWLDRQPEPRRSATALLGLYHLAQAATRTAEFLAAGSVSDDGDISHDISIELRRLIIRAEEFLATLGDLDIHFWLCTVVAVLWKIQSDSIWVTGRGISERLDLLLDELARVGRDRPIFSLLPSQQDALRQSLLDPTRVAVVLQMPTSAGKTLLAEFAIVQTVEAYRDNARVVYVVPTRALATQVRRTLTEDLRPLGIPVSAAGSAFEEDPYELNILKAADGVVVATPEKLDLMLRVHPEWFDSLRLVIIDEAHLLQDSERGVRLELLLANLRRERPEARLLLLTPFVENARQIAIWLGGNRGSAINVHWRPARLILGLATISGAGRDRSLTIEWSDPYRPDDNPKPLRIPTSVPSKDVTSTSDKIKYLAERFRPLGTILALFSASPTSAESAARSIAEESDVVPASDRTSGLLLAIALAKNEFGEDSVLAYALERGVAFHHSSLSPTLRYLIEDQVRGGRIHFIAATTTLAQGMNFPVATVLVHSIHKPYGRGNLLPSEFWNIAGRAGRVGMVDKGLVVFTQGHEQHRDRYRAALSDSVRSALLTALQPIGATTSLKQQYRDIPEIRPFLQYLAHAAATGSPAQAMADLDELIQASLANLQVESDWQAQRLRLIARSYLQEISVKQPAYLRAADTTGLGSFSFDELFARIRDDAVLRAGPEDVLRLRQEGMEHLIDALRWLPELDLAIGLGEGQMSVRAVAQVVNGWMEGKSVVELAGVFPGDDSSSQIRKAAQYLHSKVSQIVSWGAHAYLRGWLMESGRAGEILGREGMLPSYIQYGVNTPEAAVASLFGLPRQFAEPMGLEFRARHGPLSPEETKAFQEFVESADTGTWDRVVQRSPLAGAIRGSDARSVWRQMQGLPE